MTRKSLFNSNKTNLFLDVVLALLLIVELEMNFTGLRNHELLGLAFGAAIIVHIVLHWRWIVSITRTFFRKTLHESRLNYLLNIALFVDAIVMVITGIVISRTLGLSLGIETGGHSLWQQVHTLSAELSLLIVAFHIGLHWKWIATHAKKYLFSFKLPRQRVTAAAMTDVSDSPDRPTASLEV